MGRTRNKTKKSYNRNSVNVGLGSGGYFLNEQMKKDAANFNWTYPIGLKDSLFRVQKDVGSNTSLPLLQTFHVQPMIGVSNGPESATNQLARTMFNYIVRINSKNVSYEPVDLQTAIVAMNSVYSGIAWAGRLYQLCNTYSAENRAVPELLIKANGVDPDDLNRNLEDFRTWLNLYTQRAALLAIPKDIPYFNSSVEYYSKIYADENSERAQLYMFVPDCFYRYDETYGDENSVTALLPVPLGYHYSGNGTIGETPQFTENTGTKPLWEADTSLMTFDNIRDLLNSLLEPLLASEDISFICSDIYKAYGASGLVKLPTMPENASIMAEHNYAMLARIENMRIVNRARQTGFKGTDFANIGPWWPYISQDPEINKGNLTCNYYPPSGIVVYGKASMSMTETSFYDKQAYRGKRLNWHGDSAPTIDDVMSITRLIPALGPNNQNDQMPHIDVVQCGTELIVEAKMWWYYWDDDGSRQAYSESYTSCIWNTNTQNKIAWLAPAWSVYNYSPEVISCTNEVTAIMARSLYDIDVYTTISEDDIDHMHVLALLGLFRTPGYSYSIM